MHRNHHANGHTLEVLTSIPAGEDLFELVYNHTDAGQLTDQATTRFTQSRVSPPAP